MLTAGQIRRSSDHAAWFRRPEHAPESLRSSLVSDPDFRPAEPPWLRADLPSSTGSSQSPGFRHQTFAGADVCATDAALVAAIEGRALDVGSLAQDYWLGFRLGDRSIFEHVRRCTDVSPSASEDPDPIPALCACVAQAFETESAIELTGGFDSRLVLALGLHARAKPRLAITLGAPSDPDVIVAARIAAAYGISHHVLDPTAPSPDLWKDAVEFVSASGYCSNCTSYAHLPAVFRKLAPVRDGQITGAGGEIATGFYYSPLDRFSTLPGVVTLWTRLRLAKPGVSLSSLVPADLAESLRHEIEVQAASLLLPGQSWRESLDDLYAGQRIPNWAAPVLHASSAWYRVHAPLLTPFYRTWAATLTQQQRSSRQGQSQLIAKLNPQLASMPMAVDIASPGKRRKGTLAKISARLAGRRKSADLGAGATAGILAADPRAVASMHRAVGSLPVTVNAAAVDRLLAEPARYAHELGVLWTLAIADDRRSFWQEHIRKRRNLYPETTSV